MQHAMIIDYKYCTGCESCVVSCAKEKGLGAEEWGMKVEQIGPNKIGGKWEWDYVPVPSRACDLCAERVGKGKKPLCVKHCQSLVMEYGSVTELVANADGKTKYTIFVPKAGTVK